jgi:hypothetical protein
VITEPNDAEDVPVGAIQPSDENSTVKYSTGSDGKPTVDDTIALIDRQLGLPDE